MLESASKTIGFAPDALWTAIGVLIAGATIALLIINLILKIKELRKPNIMNEKTVQEKLKSDHERLCKLEETTKQQDEELKLILRSLMAITHHMEDGNGIAKLKETRSDIEEYLITGKIPSRKKGD